MSNNKNDDMQKLIMKLSSAIWKRPLIDPSFSMVEHLKNPRTYRPKTSDELECWNELTHPDRYDELVRFVEQRRRIPANGYALVIDWLVLRAAEARRAEGPTREHS